MLLFGSSDLGPSLVPDSSVADSALFSGDRSTRVYYLDTGPLAPLEDWTEFTAVLWTKRDLAGVVRRAQPLRKFSAWAKSSWTTRNVWDFTVATFDAYLGFRRESGVSGTRDMETLRRAWSYCAKACSIRNMDNPVPIPRNVDAETKRLRLRDEAFKPGEMLRMFDAAENGARRTITRKRKRTGAIEKVRRCFLPAPRLRAAMTIAHETGLRPGGLFQLQWGDINFTKRM